MILPNIMMITGENPLKENDFVNKIILHIENGIQLIQLRAKYLNETQFKSLAKKVLTATNKHNVKIILNAHYNILNELNADGIHLTSELLMSLKRRPLSKKHIISAACHDMSQLIRAQQIGVDFVTLSPVLPTNTHPEAEPLGWENFSNYCMSVQMPIFGLGGLTTQDLELVCASGGYGLAAINSLWNKEYL